MAVPANDNLLTSETALPTGILTFLLTDIEGSTSLWEQYPSQMHVMLERHDQIIRTAIEQQQGYIFKAAGDSFWAAFSSAAQALRAAYRAQKEFAGEAGQRRNARQREHRDADHDGGQRP